MSVTPLSRTCLRVLCLSALLCLSACQSPAGFIDRAAVAPVIDGQLDDACWKSAPVIDANFRFDGQSLRDPQPRLRVRYAWDEHYLYLAYDVTDANLVALPDGSPQGPADNRRQTPLAWGPEKKLDLVEFFVTMEGYDNPVVAWEIHHDAANHFGDIWTIVPPEDSLLRRSSMIPFWGKHFMAVEEYVQDDGPFRVASAVRLKPKADGAPSTVNDPRDTDTGYTAELRLPWRGLGAPTTWRVGATTPGLSGDEIGKPIAFDMRRHRIRLFAAMLDGDGPNPIYFHSSPTMPKKTLFAPRYIDWPVYECRDGARR
ncbi:MAG: hypothetical protein NTW19_09260 [Planctomycetota bacterium]|nr:hypothetical protein [Planctomycetota bacterium]